jgi:hypothetical protein
MLKYAKATPSEWNDVSTVLFFDFQGVLFVDFLIEQRAMNAAYLLFEASWRPSKARLSFKTTRSISQKRLSPPRQRASAHRLYDNRNIGGNELGGTDRTRL